jgi:hypothetical protein
LVPFLPISTPGRAVCTKTVINSPVRSTSTLGIAAKTHSRRMKRRILKSSMRFFEKSYLFAYQRDRHCSVMAMRKPVGWTF